MAVISPRGWSLDGLLHRGKNFIEVPRCRADDPNLLERIAAFEQNGIPLIIEGWHTLNSWPKELFTVDWLIEHLGKEEITVRDVNERSDYSITLGEFIARSRETAARYRKDGSQQGHLYNKDAHCPTEWEEWVQEQHLPEVLCPGSRHDMIGCLTEAEQVESLMCYLGIGGTFTPCHKDLCASSGQNLMCYTEDRGSSFWFMTESQVAPEAAQFFWDHVGKHLDWEEHTASIQDFANAPFTVYIAEQTLGDLVLVPPRSSHQVINSGGLTVKTSWSRMTVAGLETALYHELPLYRRVCRHEQYRVKHILYRAVSAKTEELKRYHQNKEVSHPTLTMTQLRELIRLFDVVLHEEYLQKHRDLRGTTRRTLGKKTSTSPSDEDVTASSARVVPNTQLSNLACDFCGADIFQSFFECTNCQDKKADVSDPMRVTVGNGLTLCPTCYVEGRTCNCGAMKTRQCRQFIQILRERNDAASVLNTVCPEQPAVICLDEKDLQSTKDVLVAEAAYRLNRYRRALLQSKKDESIQLTIEQILNCSQCNMGHNFKDLLRGGIHSAEAIMMRLNPAGDLLKDEVWHERHSKPTEARQDQLVLDADKRGDTLPCIKDKLVVLARTYGICRPLNPTYTQPGWYDSFQPDDTGSDGTKRGMRKTARLSQQPRLDPSASSSSSISFGPLSTEADVYYIQPTTAMSTIPDSTPRPQKRPLMASDSTSEASVVVLLEPPPAKRPRGLSDPDESSIAVRSSAEPPNSELFALVRQQAMNIKSLEAAIEERKVEARIWQEDLMSKKFELAEMKADFAGMQRNLVKLTDQVKVLSEERQELLEAKRRKSWTDNGVKSLTEEVQAKLQDSLAQDMYNTVKTTVTNYIYDYLLNTPVLNSSESSGSSTLPLPMRERGTTPRFLDVPSPQPEGRFNGLPPPQDMHDQYFSFRANHPGNHRRTNQHGYRTPPSRDQETAHDVYDHGEHSVYPEARNGGPSSMHTDGHNQFNGCGGYQEESNDHHDEFNGT